MTKVIKNPRKKFNFRITIVDAVQLEPFAAQDVTSPDVEIDTTEHGIANTVIKTGGLVKAGTLKIDRIISSNTGLNAAAFFDWMFAVQDPVTQTAGDPDFYKKTIRIDEYRQYGRTGKPEILNSFWATGCWPNKINGKEYSRTSSDNLVESIEFSVDYFSPYEPSMSIPASV